MDRELDPEGLVRALQEGLGPGCELFEADERCPPRGWALSPLPQIQVDLERGITHRRPFSDRVQVWRDGQQVCLVCLDPLRVCVELRVRFEGPLPRRAEEIAREVIDDFAGEWEGWGWQPLQCWAFGDRLASFAWRGSAGARLELEKPVATVALAVREIRSLRTRTLAIAHPGDGEG